MEDKKTEKIDTLEFILEQGFEETGMEIGYFKEYRKGDKVLVYDSEHKEISAMYTIISKRKK